MTSLRQLTSGRGRSLISRSAVRHRGDNFRFNLGQVALEIRAGFHLPHNSQGENSPGVNIRRVMPPDPHPMPAQIAANGQHGFVLIRKQLGQHQCQNHTLAGMAARIAEALLQLARGKARIDRERARAFPIVFRLVGCRCRILLQPIEEGFGFGQFARL